MRQIKYFGQVQDSGQVALIMVLIMTVVSAVVVSVAARISSETNLQRQSKDSTEAFLTAQAGLEDAQSKKADVTGNLGGDKSYAVTLENKGQEGLLTDKIVPGTSLDIVLNGSQLLQAIKVYWKPATSSPSAILVTKLTSNAVADMAFDSLQANGFTKVTTNGVLSGVSFPYVTPQIAVDSTVTRVRITVYGAPAFLGIEPVGELLPIQTISYKSEANVGLSDEKIKYGLQYEESKNARTPEVFDYALFSMGTIIQ